MSSEDLFEENAKLREELRALSGKLFVVATTIELGDIEHICDVVLITNDEKAANEMVINLENHYPVPGLDYDMLVPYEGAASFVRTLNKHIGEE